MNKKLTTNIKKSQSRIVLPLILMILSVLLFAGSFPNIIVLSGIQGLAAIALVPMFIAIYRTSSITNALRLGMVFGILYPLTAYYWLKNFGDFSVWTISGVCLVYMLEFSVLFGFIKIIISFLNMPTRPIALAIVWVGYEYIKSIGFAGFPWTLLAHSVHAILPLTQLARITGVWGISFLLAYSNTIIFEYILYRLNRGYVQTHNATAPKLYRIPIITRRMRTAWHTTIITHILFWCVFIGCTYIYGMYVLSQSNSITPNSTVSMLLVQQNFDSWNNVSPRKSLTQIMEQTDTALQKYDSPPQLVVWSETSLITPYQIDEFEGNRDFYSLIPINMPFLSYLKKNNMFLLTGTPWYNTESNTAYNSAVLINPQGTILGRYGKNQLVPFAELIPFSDSTLVRWLVKTFIGLGVGWSSSKDMRPIVWNNYDSKGNTLGIGTPICFEDSFAFITRALVLEGANVLINLTNVNWSKTNVAQMQQFVASRFRSIETGTTLVRSTNSGVTGVIDPWGRVIAHAPVFSSETLSVDVPIYTNNRTIFLTIGDLLGFLCALYILVLGISVYVHAYTHTTKKY